MSKTDECNSLSFDTVIVGSGAAGFATAVRLKEAGVENIAIVTEGVCMGTSRNTGSDKQTYYKLSLSGENGDSVGDMACDLFAGSCVDGDIALCEAANSAPAFLWLCALGVPFPTNRYGEYIGYRTDHDLKGRATSAGPLTSKFMTEALERRAAELDVKIIDNALAVSVIKEGGAAKGVIVWDKGKHCFHTLSAPCTVFATGGPACIYFDSVYPVGHTGGSGVCFAAGALGKNLTEWQYGLASVAPRWNVSGTYMQALPRFVSVDSDGVEREFLTEHYQDTSELLFNVFRKGYQWPFDSRKLDCGSSVVDLLVYRENVIRKRKVYLDFRANPCGITDISSVILHAECKEYLKNAGAISGAPIDRLCIMNRPAYELYLSKGVDLKKEMLEIALCAQHNNGGISVDMWWQTNIPGLFAVGEVAATHGIYRPGGSALNAGQVGALRAAKFIASGLQNGSFKRIDAEKIDIRAAKKSVWWLESLLCEPFCPASNVAKLYKNAAKRASAIAGAIRITDIIASYLEELKELILHFDAKVKITGIDELTEVFKLWDLLICQFVYLSAMTAYTAAGGKTRGSSFYRCENGDIPCVVSDLGFYSLDFGELCDSVQELSFCLDGHLPMVSSDFRKVRAIPETGGFFENIWRLYRENGNVY